MKVSISNPTTVSVRYIVDDVDACVAFYTQMLGFDVVMHTPAAFAMLSKGNLHLLLNKPGAGGAGQAMPDGAMQFGEQVMRGTDTDLLPISFDVSGQL
jgi:catechol 2,3-dioxygenase-like lactoylglutathione lyase family enzyme